MPGSAPARANHSRLLSMTYPSGYVLSFNYSSGLDASVSRLSSLSDTSGPLESYAYLGYGTVVIRSHPQPELDLTFVGTPGDGGDQYAGLDRFGRVVSQLWEVDSTAVSELLYGYDRASNRVWRDDVLNVDFGELYSYDGFDQLVGFERGELNGGRTALTGTAERSQDWDYDAVGNWNSVTTDGGSPQTRRHNPWSDPLFSVTL